MSNWEDYESVWKNYFDYGLWDVIKPRLEEKYGDLETERIWFCNFIDNQFVQSSKPITLKEFVQVCIRYRFLYPLPIVTSKSRVYIDSFECLYDTITKHIF